MRESKTLEYKKNISNTFLKTVSAYANYRTGEIKFGIDDSGHTVGIDNPEAACLDLENKINDSISPKPDYTLDINKRTGVITLTVKEGLYKPYFYKSKAYKRNDSATVETDSLESFSDCTTLNNSEQGLKESIMPIQTAILNPHTVYLRTQLK